MVPKPREVFDREYEWDDLAGFVGDEAGGLRIGVVRGRRRHGKSFLLEHLCASVGGLYTLALRQSRRMSLARFADSLSSALGYRIGQFDDWVSALDTAVDALTRAASGQVPLLVLDEFPYLVEHSPELPSAIQALYGQRGPSTRHPPFRLLLCGSAISVMSTLLSGNHALRGRAVLDMAVRPFRYRDSADYWDVAPDTAFVVDAVLGGAPGYRDVIGSAPATDAEGFYEWLERSLLNPSHILFAEPDYLLAEDPNVGDRAVYHAIWDAVSSGASTPTRIGGLIGMDAKSLGYHLRIMRDGGFLCYRQDLLRQRHPVITVADPAVRFHHAIVRPNLSDLEIRRPRIVWDRSRETFRAQILGPHFEELAREWATWYGAEAGLDDVGHVGTTEVGCRQHRGHEVDVAALGRASMPRHRNGRITLLGEASDTAKPRGIADLRRLEHIRDLLAAQGWKTEDTAFALFSQHGFEPELTEAAVPGRVLLLDLEAMYGM